MIVKPRIGEWHHIWNIYLENENVELYYAENRNESSNILSTDAFCYIRKLLSEN